MGEGSGVRERHTVSSSSETAPSSELCAFTTGGSAAPELSAFTSAILEETRQRRARDAVYTAVRVHAAGLEHCELLAQGKRTDGQAFQIFIWR